MICFLACLLLSLFLSRVSSGVSGRKAGFLWGVATAAYQTEGATRDDNRGDSIWDAFARQKGKIKNNDTGEIADDSYHRIKEDVALIKAMGLNSYRFSISWSRILPTGTLEDGGIINGKGIQHYNTLIDELVSNNIQPMVTLYHWDLPQNLQNKYGGWLDKESISRDFLAYSDICFSHFGDRVKLWLTLNEPWTYSYLGYGEGAFAPGR